MKSRKTSSKTGTPSTAPGKDLREHADMIVSETEGRLSGNTEDLSPEAMQKALHELRVHQIELEMQNEELRRTQAALEAANDRYFSFYDLAPVGFCTLSDKGQILETNLTFAAWVGVDRIALINTPLSLFVLPEDQDVYFLNQKQLFKTNESQAFELRMLNREGMAFWASLEATVTQISDNSPICRIVISNITERKVTEKALAESEKNLATMFNAITESVYLIGPEGSLLSVNNKAAQRFGLKPEDMKGKIAYLFFPENIAKSRREKIDDVFRTGREAFFEDCRSGSYFKHALYPIFDEDGKVIRIAGFSQNITDIKKVEAALQESEKNLASMFNAITESLYLIDKQGIFLSVNETAAQWFGLKPEEIKGTIAYNFLPKDLAEFRKEKIEEVFRTGREARFEDSHKGRYFKHVLYPVFDEQGKVDRLAGSSQNITNIKKAEAALQESEKNLATLFNAITESVFLLDPQGFVLSMNQTTAQRLGMTAEGMKGKVACGFLPKEVAITRRKKIKEVLRTGREVHFEDMRNGRHIKHAIYPVFGHDGKVIRLAGFSQDIHELKMAEQALRESEEKARAILDATHEAVALFNREGMLLDLNNAYALLMNKDKKEITGKCIWDYFPSEVTEFRMAIFEQVFSTGQSISLTDERNGRFYDTQVYPLFNTDGLTTRAAVFIRDITEKKQAEDELKASHARLRELSNHLQTVREQERKRIARGIHDELGQVLTAINLEISWLSKKLPKGNKALKERAEAASSLATGAIRSVRKIIAELRPSLLSDLGLAEAIKWQAGDYQKRTCIECEIGIDLLDTDLDDDISTAVFRIFQESFTNIIRHACATKATVSLKKINGEIELIVKDNGIGIDGHRRREDAFGIIGMKERAQGLGGEVRISSIPGNGSTVVARIPVKTNLQVAEI